MAYWCKGEPFFRTTSKQIDTGDLNTNGTNMQSNIDGIFNVIHQNIQSVRNKVDELEVFIGTLDSAVNAICLTERWLRPGEQFCIRGYKIASCYYRTFNLHGGSCILVEADTEIIELEHLKQKSQELVLECSAIKIKRYKVILVNIYRSPLANVNIFLHILREILEEVSREPYTLIICGDFNIDLSKSDADPKRFVNRLKTYNLTHTSHTSNSYNQYCYR